MNDEVEFNKKRLIKVDKKTVNRIKEKANLNNKGKYRLCLQHSAQDNLHEMLIVRNKGNYCRPDKHLYTTESHTIVEGAMLVILFEDNGEIREVFELSKDCYYTYRIDTNIFHMQIPITEQVVYYEVKLGPFDEKSNIYPEWAPQLDDKAEVDKFMRELEKRIKEILHYEGKYDTGME